MFADRLPGFANTTSMRVAGGLGTIPRIVSEHEEIYKGPLAFAEVEARIERLYRPYHLALQGLLEADRGPLRPRAAGRLPFHALHRRPA
jgi:N-formylglutamate amidohydrolase